MADNPTFAEIRTEYLRLTRLLMIKNAEYDAREKFVTDRNRMGSQNYSGDLYTVLNNDLLLANISSASRTIATLMSGLAAVVLAEVAYLESTLSGRVAPAAARSQQVTVQFPGDPFSGPPRGPGGMRA